MTIRSNEFMKNEEAHTMINEETFDLPLEEYTNLRFFIPRFSSKIISHWATDSQGNFYVLRTSLSNEKTPLNEALVCVPLPNNGSSADKCLVYFITDFKYHCTSNFLVESPFFQDNVLLTRLNILPSFIAYLKQKSDQRLTDTF